MIWFIAGFIVGWLVFQRPQLVTDFVNATREKIKEIVSG